MEIKGTDEELKKFYEKKKEKAYHEWSPNQKRWFIAFIVTIVTILTIGFVISTLWDSYNKKNYYTRQQCLQMYMENNEVYSSIPWYTLVYSLVPYIPLIVICICVAWVIHGVGFKII